MKNSYNEAKQILQNNNQNHLLMFYDKLNENKKEELLNQIFSIDFAILEKLYENVGKHVGNNKKVEPIDYVDKYKMQKEDYEKYEKIGQEELQKGKLAVITMAGGQGTRLRT